MTGTGASWWLDDDKRWRRGTPPAGWTQGPDGRWHPPSDAQDQTTQELVVIGASWSDPPVTGPPTPTPTQRSPGARHLTSGRPGNRRPPLPLWMKVAVPALVAVIVGAAAGVLTIAGGARSTSDPADEVAGPATRPDVAPPTIASSAGPAAPTEPVADPAGGATPETSAPGEPVTTTTPLPPTTPSTEPALPAPSDPLAACSTGQRNVIERGNHPWEWYVSRFDEDGDGILCT